jgi:hypothetical protein
MDSKNRKRNYKNDDRRGGGEGKKKKERAGGKEGGRSKHSQRGPFPLPTPAWSYQTPKAIKFPPLSESNLSIKWAFLSNLPLQYSKDRLPRCLTNEK